MFRHERPQKGRYRQFHQLGVEAFGMEGPDIDAEMLLMTARMWERLGIKDVVLQINSLGTPASRASYREALVDYLAGHKSSLDEDSLRRLESNPLRILDSKNPDIQQLVEDAPAMADFLDDDSRAHFDALRLLLDAAGIAYEVNPSLVRGLDYYTKTVFEWVTGSLGAQGTICAGGRYDGLVEYLGGKSTPAFGFALGLERLLAMLAAGEAVLPDNAPHIYLVINGDKALYRGLVFADELREVIPGLRLLTNCGNGSFKSQFKRADKSGARYALVIGDEEAEQGNVVLKPLRDDSGQKVYAQQETAGHLCDLLGLERIA
jgi:histidyl-tRNA synthetase